MRMGEIPARIEDNDVRITAIPWKIRSRALAAACALALGVAAFAASPAQALTAAGPQRVTVAGSHPAWAMAAADKGVVASGTAITARVYLTGADPAGLAAYAAEVSEPGSSVYGQYLAPAQYEQRFGPTAAQVSAVRDWLASAGLLVTSVTSHYVAFSGTEAEVSAAFGAPLHLYRVDGAVQRAPATALTTPAAVSSSVLTVLGLTTGSAKVTHDTVSQQAPPASPAECSRYWGQVPAAGLPTAYGQALDYDLCGYTPDQFREAYGVAGSGLTGKGVRIAVVDPGAAPTVASDVDTYSLRHGIPALRPGQFTQYVPSDITTSCGTLPYGEEDGDIEAAHGMAPDASIVYVASDCSAVQDVLDAESEIVDSHLADIVTDSWGLGLESQMPAGVIPAFEQVFEQGAAEGIGFYFSSGDSGDGSPVSANGQPAVQYPGSDPWVTSVGGTSLATTASGGYKWETGWGDDIAPLSASGTSWTSLPGTFFAGAGGGASALFAQPSYQSGTVPASLSHPDGSATAMRVIPDIAADADLATGMLIGTTSATATDPTPAYIEQTVGGTSVSTPLIAGLQADAEQALGHPIGFADPAIYERYGTPAYNDVTDFPLGRGTEIATVYPEFPPLASGEPPDYAVTLGQDTSLNATGGYSDIAGVGTPTAAYFWSYLRR
jgi:subtilase family serine protease